MVYGVLLSNNVKTGERLSKQLEAVSTKHPVKKKTSLLS